MKPRLTHSTANVASWIVIFLALAGILHTFISMLFRAEVKPERVEPACEEEQEEPKIAVLAYVVLFAILSAVTLVLLLAK